MLDRGCYFSPPTFLGFEATSLDAAPNIATFSHMSIFRYLQLAPFFIGNWVWAQNATSSSNSFGDRGFWEDALDNPGHYSYVLIIFIVLGYFLWKVQGLGEDD
ncbi:MAG: hypothetical protein CMI31_08045 [Opitutae bacterium]|nr:hypothetical protein [Opitutae bacterium]